MSRMFTLNGKRLITWNLSTGCNFDCTYCWARKLAQGRLRRSYADGFIPATHPERFNKRFKPGDFVFAISMGDIAFASLVVIDELTRAAKKYPDTSILLCTKSPEIFRYIPHEPNFYFGATIETNRDYGLTRAPSPLDRYLAMWNIEHTHKFIAIEPIMDFDLLTFVRWIGHIKPQIIEVGADNYKNNLPEPEADKVNALLVYLRQICSTVVEKPGLERLKGIS